MSLSLPKILLVEDDDILRDINAMKLELDGFTFKTAKHGLEALTILESFKADIIVLDMMMPVMNGLEFLRRYRDIHGQCDVIVFSNISSPESTNEVLELGAREYLNKSRYTPEELTDHLRTYWANR
jgi:CheY-like chemotaxis protein